jgi:multidrug efflux pump subunit AcrB
MNDLTQKAPWDKGPIAWMVHHPVASNLVMFSLIIGGLLMTLVIKREVFPVFDIDQVQILVPYPSASPAEVEKGVLLPIEEALSSIDGIDEVVATAKENVANIMVKALTSTDAEQLTRDVQNAIDRINTFPEDIESPVVQLLTMHRRGLNIALHGPAKENVRQDLADRFRDELLAYEDITSVKLSGTRRKEISIELSADKLIQHGLTFSQVAKIVRASAKDHPAGSIKADQGEWLIRIQERKDFGLQFENISILDNGSSVLRLRDIADVRDGYEDQDIAIRWNGESAILIDVNLQGDTGPVEISQAVKEVIEKVKPQLPAGMGIDILYDDSNSYRDRMDLLLRNAATGLSLVFVMLALLLRGKLAFWVTIGIPTSFLAALIFLPSFEVSINMVSLFAFIIALGIVVDDAIVIGENIFEWRKKGVSAIEASIRGAQEVALPVTFSILTNVAAFIPLAFVPGTMGKIFRLIPVVVILIFIASLIESLFVLPSHLAHGKTKAKRMSFLQQTSDGFDYAVETFFTPLVDLTLRFRYIALSLALGIFICSIFLIKSGILGFSLFPTVEADRAIATVSFPYGTPASITLSALQEMRSAAERVLEKCPEKDLGKGIIEMMGTSGGQGSTGSHIGEIQVLLKDPQERELTVTEFVKMWRAECPTIHGVRSLVMESDRGGPGSGAALTIQIRHNDLKSLDKINTEVVNFLQSYSMVSDIQDGFAQGKPQLDFKLTDSAKSLGLTAEELSSQLRGAYTGSEALRQLRGRNEVRVRVKLDEIERNSLNHLNHMLIQLPHGGLIPLREATQVQYGFADTEITHYNGARSITLQADVTPKAQAGLIKEECLKNLVPELQKKYPGVQVSFEGRQKDMIDSMKVLGLGFIIAIFGIYFLLAIPFNSYTQPMIIMISIPFGIIGAIIGHYLMGFSLSVMSMFGVVALAGVVVNDSLVLIEYANRLYSEGHSAYSAVRSASIRRFRPIFLTSVTTFGGLAPMILETSPQARFLIPMAISLGFGILFATVIALLIVPSVYLVFEDIKVSSQRLLKGLP